MKHEMMEIKSGKNEVVTTKGREKNIREGRMNRKIVKKGKA